VNSEILIYIYRIGLAILLTGAILSNLAVRKMVKIVNREREGQEIIIWGPKMDRTSRKVIRMYRAKHGNGPLYRDLKIAYWICGIGAAMACAGALIGR
jgi:hypothetical protein